MTDFAIAWELSRGRFVAALDGLTAEQLNFRLHPNSLTIGEMALHVAGVEVSFATQLLGQTPVGDLERLRMAATDGSVNDNPFPFSVEEITPARVAESLLASRALAEQVILEPTPEILAKEIQSALGPIITGSGALARLAFHPGYHQGQVYLIATSPGFPSGAPSQPH